MDKYDRIHQVEIRGRVFSLRSDQGEARIQAIASLVRDKMDQIEQATSTVDSFRLGLLTALNIADDYLALKAEVESEQKRESQIEQDLIRKMRQALKEH